MEKLLSSDELDMARVVPTRSRKIIFFVLGIVIFLLFFYFLFLSAPRDFPVGTTVNIQPGMSLRGISLLLERQHIIKSRTAFESFIVISGAELHIQSADYLFERKLPVFEVAWRIARGEHHMAPVSVTIPEGFDMVQIADTFASKLKNFSKDQFLSEAREGYLFPDTYFFLPTDTEKEVLQSMTANFEKKVGPLLPQIASLGKTENDIIVMASIIEREAKGDADRAVISGILWKRISIGMPLQVDAAPETYKNKGLPDTPIGNPGLLSIEAAMHPQISPYVYYLHDKNGQIHYAKTFTEHKLNEQKYL